jgi:hypothetical protein
MDVSTTTDVPAGVDCAQRTTEPVTGEPGSVNGSDTQYPKRGLNAVVAVATVEALPAVAVTVVVVENVAFVAVATVDGGVPAVADTSGAATKNAVMQYTSQYCRLAKLLLAYPIGIVKAPVDPDDEYALAITKTLVSWLYG